MPFGWFFCGFFSLLKFTADHSGKGFLMRIIYQIIAVICFLLLLLTLVLNLVCYGAVDFATLQEEVTLTPSNPLYWLGAAVLILALLLAAHYLYKKAKNEQDRKKRFMISLIVLLVIEALFCLYWQTHYDNAPLADQKQVWQAAVAIAEGSSLDNASYFILLPRQKAMALCFAVVAKLFGTDYDTSIRPLNAVFLLLLVCWNALLAYRLSKKEEAGSICGLLTVLFSPLVYYTCFVYGTIPSLALTAGTFYFAVRLVQTGKMRYLLPETLCALLAILVYSAACIGAIAVFVILLLAGFRLVRKNWKKALTVWAGAVLPLILPYLALQMVPAVFESLTGIASTDTAAPTLTWIVMGLSSSSNTVAGPGSYNKLPETVMQDGETTAEASARLFTSLKTILAEYLSGERSLSFFIEKLLYQWTDPWFGSITLTLVQRGGARGGRGAFTAGTSATSVSMSSLASLQPFLVIFHLAVIVLAVLCVFTLLPRQKKESFTAESFCILLPAVYFAGVFLFQLVWESKSRYCLPAFVLLFPLAACAVEELLSSQKAKHVLQAFIE